MFGPQIPQFVQQGYEDLRIVTGPVQNAGQQIFELLNAGYQVMHANAGFYPIGETPGSKIRTADINISGPALNVTACVIVIMVKPRLVPYAEAMGFEADEDGDDGGRADYY